MLKPLTDGSIDDDISDGSIDDDTTDGSIDADTTDGSIDADINDVKALLDHIHVSSRIRSFSRFLTTFCSQRQTVRMRSLCHFTDKSLLLTLREIIG